MKRGAHTKHTKKSTAMRARLAISACLTSVVALVFCIGILSVNVSQSTPPDEATPASSSASVESDATTDTSTEGKPYSGEDATTPTAVYASVPQDEYVPNTVVISIDDEQDVESARAALGALGFAGNASINADDAACGFVTLTYEGAASAGEVADQLQAQGLTAQPNFKYYALDLDEDEGTQSPTIDDEAGLTAASPNSDVSASEDVVPDPQGNTDEADSPLVAQATSVNDPLSGQQWGLQAIQARDAWSIAKCRPSAGATRRVSVAVIDSGCNINHPDLRNNIVGTYDTITGGSAVADEQNHGTPVAGIIAAEANNGIGVAGISYNAGLYIVRALHKQNGDFVAQSTDIIKAYRNIIANKTINYSTGEKIRVVNMSLGSKRTGELGENDAAIMRVIDEAYNEHDLLTVSAAGNRDGNLPYRCFPCDFSDNIIGVINIKQDLTRESDSNYNVSGRMTKQLSAPGTSILTTMAGGGYDIKSGTSMAAPCVTGVVALAFAANPNLTAKELKSILFSAADDIGAQGFDNLYGYGKINALSAVNLAKSKAAIAGPDSLLAGTTTNLKCPGAGTWSSSNPSVASVNSSGVVRGVKPGYTTISVSANGQTLKKTITVYDGKVSGPSSLTANDTAQYKVESSIDGNWTFEVSSNKIDATITETGKLTAKAAGQVTITARLDSNPSISARATVNIAQPTSKVMYRLYNPNSGEHFYTADATERDRVSRAGWKYEGEGWTAPAKSNTPVYRLYSGTDHHYTTDASERDNLVRVGWKYEGIGWYSDDAKGVALHRLFNPNVDPQAPRNNSGSHHYTTDASERERLVRVGWKYEGYAWYGMR